MKKENKIRLLGMCLLPVLLLAFVGCASTKYVNEKVGELEGKLQEHAGKMDDLDRQLAQVDAKADEAKKGAEEARMEAERALKNVKPLGSYNELGKRQINFDFDKYVLTNIARNVLDEIGGKMQQDPGLVLEISGHADAIGPEKYNLVLGHNRAESVKRYLTEKFNVSVGRMYVVSFGELKPVADNDSPKGRASNRRVELRLLGP